MSHLILPFSCRAHHYPEPVYKVNGSDINVFFPIDPNYEEPGISDYSKTSPDTHHQNTSQTNNDSLEQRILDELEKTPTITQTTLAAHVGIGRRTLQRIISSLMARNKLTRIGSSRKGKWQVLPEKD